MAFPNIFASKPAQAAAPAQGQAAPANPQQGQAAPQLQEASTQAFDPVSGAPLDPTNQPPEEKSGLADFSALWDTPSTEGDATPAQSSLLLSNDNLTPVMDKMNFAANLPPEMTARLEQGDMSALTPILEHVARNVYSNAMQHSTALVDKHLESRLDAMSGKMETAARSAVTKQSVAASIPTDNPLVRSEMNRISEQLQVKYPDAPAAWVAEQAQRYITELAGAFGSGDSSGASQAPAAPEQVDFMEFAGAGAQQ